MNKSTTSILLLLICIITVNAQNKFKISGKLEGFKENALIKIYDRGVLLDSCYLKNKIFELNGTLENEPTITSFKIKNGDSLVNTSFFIGNENINVNTKIDDFPFNVKTQGSKYDQLRYDYYQLVGDLYNQLDKLTDEVDSLKMQNKWNDSLQETYWGKSGRIKIIYNKVEKITDKFIKKYFNSYYGVYLLNNHKADISRFHLQKYYNKLSLELKNTPYAKAIELHLKYPQLEIGDKYYDFTAYDKNHKKKKFSDYFTGKLVLLDFSSPYCGFCMKILPELEDINKSQTGKLEIVTYYSDESKEGLQDLVNKHDKNWNILWSEDDLGDVYNKYKIQITPTFYLFDQNGNLIYKANGIPPNLGQIIEEAINDEK